MAANALGIILFRYADWLRERGYSRNTIHQYTQAVEHFGFWRQRRHPTSREVKHSEVREFLTLHLPGCSCPVPATKSRRTCRAALHRLTTMLGLEAPKPHVRHSAGPIETLVLGFDRHMAQVCGLSEATRFYRKRYAREFLAWRFQHEVDPTRLCFADFLGYVQFRAPLLKPVSAAVMIVALRAFVRFLEFEQRCPPELWRAWPSVARWKKSAPPDVLTRSQCRDLLRRVDVGSPSGHRDAAILRLIVDLGLRCSEVAQLCLEDIDWRASVLTVRKNKQRRERSLPMPEPVGRAIFVYLRTARPESSSRQ